MYQMHMNKGWKGCHSVNIHRKSTHVPGSYRLQFIFAKSCFVLGVDMGADDYSTPFSAACAYVPSVSCSVCFISRCRRLFQCLRTSSVYAARRYLRGLFQPPLPTFDFIQSFRAHARNDRFSGYRWWASASPSPRSCLEVHIEASNDIYLTHLSTSGKALVSITCENRE